METMAPQVAPNTPAEAHVPESPFTYQDPRYDTYWDGQGAPTTRQLRRLERGVQDLGTGQYGEHLRGIATKAIDVIMPGDTKPTLAAFYNDDFADRARAFKATDDEDERGRIIEDMVLEFETDVGITLTPEDSSDIKDQARKDLAWAASLKDSKGKDALDTLDQAVTDYRALEERALLARESYDAAHGKVFTGGAGVLRRLKQGMGGLGLGDVIATTTGKVAARMYAGEKPLNPETMSKVRRTARTGAALLMLGGVSYMRAKGLGDFHFDDGGTTAEAASSADNVARGASEARPDQTEHVLPTETHELGEAKRDSKGRIDGTVWEEVREYADKHDIDDDLTKKEFIKAVDNVLERNDVGGEGASYSERWEAASHMSADDKITIGANDFKGMVPDNAGADAPKVVNHGSHPGDHNTAPHDAGDQSQAEGDAGLASKADTDSRTNSHTGEHDAATPATHEVEHDEPSLGLKIGAAAAVLGVAGGVGAAGVPLIRETIKDHIEASTAAAQARAAAEYAIATAPTENPAEAPIIFTDADEEDEDAPEKVPFEQLDRAIRYLESRGLDVGELNAMSDIKLLATEHYYRDLDAREAPRQTSGAYKPL